MHSNTYYYYVVPLFRIADVFYIAKSMTYYYDGDKTLLTALKGAYLNEKSDLSGYMALTDYFFYLIRYSGQESVKKVRFKDT